MIRPPAPGRTPFPGNVIPPNRLNPVAVAMASYLPAPDTDVSNGSANFNRTARDQRSRLHVYRQGRSPLQRQGFAERVLSLQQDRRALRQLLGARAERRQSLCRSRRLHPAAPRAHARAQQHLAAEQQHGGDAALRLEPVPRQQHAVHRFRSRQRSVSRRRFSQRHRRWTSSRRSTSPTTTTAISRA